MSLDIYSLVFLELINLRRCVITHYTMSSGFFPSYYKPRLFRSHRAKHSTNVFRYYICVTCNKVYTHHASLTKHYSYAHKQKYTVVEPPKQLPRVLENSTEPRIFKPSRSIVSKRINEQNQIKDTTFKCPYCPRVLTKIYTLLAHVYSYHNPRKSSTSCTFCRNKYQRLSYLGTHTASHINLLKCRLCGVQCYFPEELKTHRKMCSLRSNPTSASSHQAVSRISV